MRVLMLGWEFPPHISGGLGTACQGIVRGLTQIGTDVLLVVPRLYGDEDARGARLVAAGDVPLPPEGGGRPGAVAELTGRLQLAYVDSALRPYQSRPGYTALLRGLRRARPRAGGPSPRGRRRRGQRHHPLPRPRHG